MGSKLTEPHEDDGDPTRYNMLGPIVRAGRNDDAHNKLTDEHALDDVSTSIVIDLTISVCTYLHYLQELEVCGRPCPAT
jgi:hypothetical protein